MSLSDDWKLTEYTLAANQLLSDWKNRKLTWNEEVALGAKFMNKAESVIEDIAESVREKVQKGNNLVVDGVTTVELREFDLRAFKLTKA